MTTQLTIRTGHLQNLRLTSKSNVQNNQFAQVFTRWLYSFLKSEILSTGTHFCSFSKPCSRAYHHLGLLYTLGILSKTWFTMFTQFLDGFEYFSRCEDAFYPHAWHINARVRKASVFGQYRVFKTLDTEDGDRGIFLAYDYSGLEGCSAARQVIVKAWTDPMDSACIAENSAYQALTNPFPILGIPIVLRRGIDKRCGIFAIVLEKLGPSLDTPFNVNWNERTLFALATRLLDIYEAIHSRGIIHNGIKPANICFPSSFDCENSDMSQLYVIDFDVSFRMPSTSSPTPTSPRLPCPDHVECIGNRTFLSVFGHLGIEQSQRDDLESLAYLISYLFHGSLPWLGTSSSIWRVKMAMSASALFAGMDEAFVRYWDAVKGLAFGEVPDYAKLRSIFQQA